MMSDGTKSSDHQAKKKVKRVKKADKTQDGASQEDQMEEETPAPAKKSRKRKAPAQQSEEEEEVKAPAPKKR